MPVIPILVLDVYKAKTSLAVIAVDTARGRLQFLFALVILLLILHPLIISVLVHCAVNVLLGVLFAQANVTRGVSGHPLGVIPVTVQ